MSITFTLVSQGCNGDLRAENNHANYVQLQSVSLQSTLTSHMTSLHAHWYNNLPREFASLMSHPVLTQVILLW